MTTPSSGNPYRLPRLNPPPIPPAPAAAVDSTPTIEDDDGADGPDFGGPLISAPEPPAGDAAARQMPPPRVVAVPPENVNDVLNAGRRPPQPRQRAAATVEASESTEDVRWYLSRQFVGNWKREVWGDHSREDLIAKAWKMVRGEKRFTLDGATDEAFTARLHYYDFEKQRYLPTKHAVTFELPKDAKELESTGPTDTDETPMLDDFDTDAAGNEPQAPKPPALDPEQFGGSDPVMKMMMMQMNWMMQQSLTQQARADRLMMELLKPREHQGDHTLTIIRELKDVLGGNRGGGSAASEIVAAMKDGMNLVRAAGNPQWLDMFAIGAGLMVGQPGSNNAAKGGADDPLPLAPAVNVHGAHANPPAAAPAVSVPAQPAPAALPDVATTQRQALWQNFAFIIKGQKQSLADPSYWALRGTKEWEPETLRYFVATPAPTLAAECVAFCQTSFNVAVPERFASSMIEGMQAAFRAMVAAATAPAAAPAPTKPAAAPRPKPAPAAPIEAQTSAAADDSGNSDESETPAESDEPAGNTSG